jgi:hypothetical protein
MSPDPLQPSRSHPLVLDQFLADPQNWNKYAYSLDNPVTYRDRDGHFTGDDHERIQMNAMLAHGYSREAAQVAATSDRNMDHWYNAAPGIPIGNHVTTNNYQNRVNPQHGERGEHQTRGEAQAAASQFISSTVGDAAQRALQGDVRGALADLGQASHTAQDIVRHNFERGSEHPYHEAPATPGEVQSATQATNNVLDEFSTQLYTQGLQRGLNFEQIAGIMQSVLQGQPPPLQDTTTSGYLNDLLLQVGPATTPRPPK